MTGLCALVLAGCREEQKPAASEPPAPKVAGETIAFATNAPQLAYVAAEAAQPRRTTAAALFGRLAWDDDVTVRIFAPIGGRVLRLDAEVGREVAADDVLAQIASPDYGQAQSDVRKATSDLALSEKILSREQELFEHGAVPKKDLEAAEADHEKAVAELQRAQAQLAALSRGQTKTVDGVYLLRSPLRGVVVDKNITPGQLIRPDMMLANAAQFTNPQFVVSEPTKLWLFLDVTELDAVALKPGQEVHLHTKAYPDQTFTGRVEIVGQALDPATRTLKARALVDNPGKLLRAEMYVTAEVVGEPAAGVDVSAKAVFLKSNQYYVFVETAPGHFERRAVKLGPENAGTIAIVDGLVPGQRVVTEGSLLLQALLEGGGNS